MKKIQNNQFKVAPTANFVIPNEASGAWAKLQLLPPERANRIIDVCLQLFDVGQKISEYNLSINPGNAPWKKIFGIILDGKTEVIENQVSQSH